MTIRITNFHLIVSFLVLSGGLLFLYMLSRGPLPSLPSVGQEQFLEVIEGDDALLPSAEQARLLAEQAVREADAAIRLAETRGINVVDASRIFVQQNGHQYVKSASQSNM